MAFGTYWSLKFFTIFFVGLRFSHGLSVFTLSSSSIFKGKWLNFDSLVLNFTKHTSYLTYSASLFFSPIVQKQYSQEFGSDQMIPLAANDVALSVHSVVLIALILFQISIYDVSHRHKHLISILQAFFNFKHKSTVGFSIGFSWKHHKPFSDGCAIYRSRVLGEPLGKHRQAAAVFGGNFKVEPRDEKLHFPQ